MALLTQREEWKLFLLLLYSQGATVTGLGEIRHATFGGTTAKNCLLVLFFPRVRNSEVLSDTERDERRFSKAQLKVFNGTIYFLYFWLPRGIGYFNSAWQAKACFSPGIWNRNTRHYFILMKHTEHKYWGSELMEELTIFRVIHQVVVFALTHGGCPLDSLTDGVALTDNTAWLCRDYCLTSSVRPRGAPCRIILSTVSAPRGIAALCAWVFVFVCVCGTIFLTSASSAKGNYPASAPLSSSCLGKHATRQPWRGGAEPPEHLRHLPKLQTCLFRTRR